MKTFFYFYKISTEQEHNSDWYVYSTAITNLQSGAAISNK
jgi:hypothetical protein